MRVLLTGIILFVAFIGQIKGQNVGIGTTTPHNSALMEFNSNSKGILTPRMSSSQRNSIVMPAKGLLVFDSDTNSFWFHNGSTWTELVAGNWEGINFPFDTTLTLSSTAFRVSNNANGIAGVSSWGSGINGSSNSGAGVSAFSGSYYAISAHSSSNTAIYAYNNHANPTIYGTNSNAIGVGVKGNSNLSHGVLGTSAGASTAGVRGEATGASGIGVFGISSSNSGTGVHGHTTAGTGVYGFSSSGIGVKAFSGSGLALEVTGNLKISGGNTTPSDGAVLTSDASGNAVWTNNRVAFASKRTGEITMAVDQWIKVEYQEEEYDLTNSFLPPLGSPGAGTSMFTAPKNGIYHFDARSIVGVQDNINSICRIRLRLKRNGITTTIAYAEATANSFWSVGRDADITLGRDVKLMANDQVWIEASQTNFDDEAGIIGSGYFNGHFVCEY